MHACEVAFYGAGAFYALFMDRGVLIPFFIILALYMILPCCIPNAKQVSTHRRVLQAGWSDPSEPNVLVRVPIRTEKVEKIIQQSPQEIKLSVTHFCVKALGEVLATQPYLNGILTLGRFVEKERVDINCLVNIDGGKDLAMLIVKGADKMSVQDIARFVNSNAKTMKKDDGGQNHKQQMLILHILPAFLISAISKIIFFFVFKLRLHAPSLGLCNDSFGTACVTSVGSLGIEDATAPFTPLANWTVLLTANKILKEAVVEDDKIVIGHVMNCNFNVDHRYVNGGSCTKLLQTFRDVFENPQKYMDKTLKKLKKQ